MFLAKSIPVKSRTGAAALTLLLFSSGSCIYLPENNNLDQDAYPYYQDGAPNSSDAEQHCGAARPVPRRDPATGRCLQDTIVEDPVSGECIPGSPVVVDVSLCRANDSCAGMDEPICRATPGCRAIYAMGDPNLDCSECECYVFLECWAAEPPRQPLEVGGCDELDANLCAMFDTCIGVHSYDRKMQATGFERCTSEAGHCSGCGAQARRNPESGMCEEIDRCPSAGSYSEYPDWGFCGTYCEKRDEVSCLSEPGCHPAYVDPGIGSACSPLLFVGCWHTAPSRVATGEEYCSDLDGYQCSRRDDCVPVHRRVHCPPNARCARPYAEFLYCASKTYLDQVNRIYSLRDPSSGQCQDCNTLAYWTALQWGRCNEHCDELDEARCVATPGCRAAYALNLRDMWCESSWFVGCWTVAPPSESPLRDCAELAALECSQRDDCAAYHEAWPPCDDQSNCGSDPAANCPCPEYGTFVECGPEKLLPPPPCDTIEGELECIETAGCMPLYQLVPCPCEDGKCTCESYYEFHSCTDAAAPPPDDGREN
ncbi:MAG: hypothetical protein V2A73_12120 [Pseudomonadota bacterium]